MRSHTKEKPFPCSHCHLSFKHSSTLKVHLFTHTKVSPYKCGGCDKYFPVASKLTEHHTSACGNRGAAVGGAVDEPLGGVEYLVEEEHTMQNILHL